MIIKEISNYELKKQIAPLVRKGFDITGEQPGELKFINTADNFIEGLRIKFGLMEIDAVKQAILNGIYGDYDDKYNKFSKITAKALLTWVRLKFNVINEKKMFDTDNRQRNTELTKEIPYGAAIVFKMKHVKIKNWEVIPLKAIAGAVKEKLNMEKFFAGYGIELISRKQKLFTNHKINYKKHGKIIA